MGPLERTSAFIRLAESRAGWVAAALVALFGVGASFAPLLKLPGYELAEGLAILDALLVGPLAISLATRDRPSPPLRCALASAGWISFLDLVVIGVFALRAVLTTRCSPFTGLPFALLLPFPSAFLGGALGAGAAALLPRRRWATALYYLIVAGLLGHALWGGYFGPQAFGYDHLLGYFPGPLYDEDLRVPVALWLFRALTLGAIAIALMALASFRRLALPLLGLFLWATGSLEHLIGSRSSVADLDRALGGIRSSEGLVMHFPRELDRKRVEKLWHVALVARAQVAAALSVPENTPVDVFLHRSAAEKAALTGAGQTHFTKPWLGQIQSLVDSPQIVRHEMVHALAATVGGGIFGVGRPLLPNMGIIEGLAEAVDWPAERYTDDEWAAALLADHRMPEVKDLLVGSAAFYATAQGTAYAVAGSFLHWLLANRGAAAVATLYRTENFQTAFGVPLARLSDEFDAFLGQVAVSPQLAHAAAERFRQRSIFARPCSRELASLRDRAAEAEARGDASAAAERLARCATLDPGDPRWLEARWRALREAHLPEANQALADLLASPAADDAVRARAAVVRGDLAFLAGQDEEARSAFNQARELGLDPPNDRATQIRLLALDYPDLAEPLHRYLEGPQDDVALLGLSEATETHPNFGPLRYLIGFALWVRGEPSWSMDELEKALDLGLPDDLSAQALRVEVDDEIQVGKFDVAAERLARLMPYSKSPAGQRLADDLESRLSIERRLFPDSPSTPR